VLILAKQTVEMAIREGKEKTELKSKQYKD